MLLKNCVKKVWLVVVVLLLTVVFVGCKKEPDITDEKKVEEALASIIVEDPSRLTGSFNVVSKTSVHDLDIVWTVKKLDNFPVDEAGKPLGASIGATAADGRVTIAIEPDPFTGVDEEGNPTNGWRGAILVATVTSGDVTSSREWEMYIAAEPFLYSIKELFSLNDGAAIRIEGTIVHIIPDQNKRFFIQDEAGNFMYVHSTVCEGAKVGDKVSVTGKYTVYYGQPEVTDATSEIIEAGTSFDIKTIAKTLSATQLGALDTEDKENYNFPFITSGYVIENPVSLADGTTKDSSSPYGIQDINGNYFSIYKPTDEEETQLGGLVGKYVELVSMACSKHSIYLFWRSYILSSTIKETEAPKVEDQDKIDNTKATLENLLKDKLFAVDIELPTTNALYSDVTITWASSHPAIVAADGKVTLPDEETTVTLTATIKAGAKTQDVEIAVKISASFVKVTVAEALAACDKVEDIKTWVEGKIIGLDKSGNPYIADETGVIYARGKLPEGVVVGDVVKAIGSATVYVGGGTNQYTRQLNSATFEKLDTTVTVAAAKPVLIADMNATYANADGKITDESKKQIAEFAYNGAIITIKGFVTLRGSYNNLWISVDATDESQGVVYYWSNDEESIAQLTALEGKEVTITCPIYDYAVDYGWRLGSAIEITEGAELPPVTGAVTVAEAQALENDAAVKVVGVVTYVYKQGFYVQDETGSIYVYTKSAAEVALGEEVVVEGTKGYYNGHQIANPTFTVRQKVEFTPTGADSTLADIKAMPEANGTYGKIFKVKFTPVVSGDYVNAKDGELTLNLYNNDDTLEVLKGYADQEVEAYVMLYAYYAKGATWNLFVFKDSIVPVA